MDLYLKAADEATMNAALLAAGLMVEQTETDEEGNVTVTGAYPAQGVSLDVIGPIVRVVGYDDDGEPIVQEYPEWHVNLRADLNDEQIEAVAPFTITPPETPFRVWA